MPNPLSTAWNWLNTPVVSQQTLQPVTDAIDARSLDQSPLGAGVRGFAAGALEGLRGLATPLNIAATALPLAGEYLTAGRAAKVVPEAVQGLREAPVAAKATRSGDLMADFLGSEGPKPGFDWPEAGGRYEPDASGSHRLAAQPTLGETNPEFTPVGEEAAHNSLRKASNVPIQPSPEEAAYQRLAANGNMRNPARMTKIPEK